MTEKGKNSRGQRNSYKNLDCLYRGYLCSFEYILHRTGRRTPLSGWRWRTCLSTGILIIVQTSICVNFVQHHVSNSYSHCPSNVILINFWNQKMSPWRASSARRDAQWRMTGLRTSRRWWTPSCRGWRSSPAPPGRPLPGSRTSCARIESDWSTLIGRG